MPAGYLSERNNYSRNHRKRKPPVFKPMSDEEMRIVRKLMAEGLSVDTIGNRIGRGAGFIRKNLELTRETT